MYAMYTLLSHCAFVSLHVFKIVSIKGLVTCHLLSIQQIKVNTKSLAGSWEVPLGDAFNPYLLGDHVYKPWRYVPYALKPVSHSLKGELAHA